ncbi:MAG: hypothetical protein KBC35_02670 [Candidatus Pacebacteria bacterium]|nr:hypothetical protein [Candidatus Paceibacterota bacterium]
MIQKKFLQKKYDKEGLSAAQIAMELRCSENKVHYWLNKYQIKNRSISEAQYLKHNPDGDPFVFRNPTNETEWFLYGLGLGLWWGEGNKVSRTAIRLGNTDPDLLRYFLDFLKVIYRIDESRLRFGLQIFTDINPEAAQKYWSKKLGISQNKFQKPIVTQSVRIGTYKNKAQYGVLTIYFSNTKIRDTIYGAIEKLRTDTYANIAQSVERIHGGSHRSLPTLVVTPEMNPE